MADQLARLLLYFLVIAVTFVIGWGGGALLGALLYGRV